MSMTVIRAALRHARAQDGFTMIVALGVMLATSLLLAVVLAAANGDVHLSRTSTLRQQAYYAALAGIQEYESELNKNPSYWQTCPKPAAEVTEKSAQRYEVNPLPANGKSSCEPENPFESMIESSSARLSNTFRIESTGCAGKEGLTSCQGQQPSAVAKLTLVATFQVTGFLDYAFSTRYEITDPNLENRTTKEIEECSNYYAVRVEKLHKPCGQIYWGPEDSVAGPVHTDDAASVCGSVSFGEAKRVPPDKVEINGGITKECAANPTFNTATKEVEKGTELIPPPNDESMALYAEAGYTLHGAARVELNGTSNEIIVTEENGQPLNPHKELPWPKNGLLYVEKGTSGTCSYEYSQKDGMSDNATEEKEETGCGTVYVGGSSYKKALTIAAERELVITGNIVPTGVTPGNAPTGTATLGLIASKYLRVYHTCSSTASPWIYAALLSTAHVFAVDNFECGSLETLNVYGAIAQNFRGAVGLLGSTGFRKNYHYDRRLATDEPPYFLAPLKTGWRLDRVTALEKG